jgi:hypothetical protein
MGNDVFLMLAGSSIGRMLLHLGALVGDGAFRFHLSGIARELRWERAR